MTMVSPSGLLIRMGVVGRATLKPFMAEYERYARLAWPTKVLGARADRATPFENCTTFVKLVPGAQVVPLSRVGHASPCERPGLITDAILAQVRRTHVLGKGLGGTP